MIKYNLGLFAITLIVILSMEFASKTQTWKKPDEDNSSISHKPYGAKRFSGLYKGARPRDGKWVVEIRIPKTKKRIWLGSHDTAEAAAQAYDDASYCIYGPEGPCNFPNNRSPPVPGQLIGTKTTDEIIRIVQESTPGQNHIDYVKMVAHQVSPDPLFMTTVSENGHFAPQLDFTTNAVVTKSYVPTFIPEQPSCPWEILPFDEELMKESDKWILDFLAEMDEPKQG